MSEELCLHFYEGDSPTSTLSCVLRVSGKLGWGGVPQEVQGNWDKEEVRNIAEKVKSPPQLTPANVS